jgi:hypothetical protein
MAADLEDYTEREAVWSERPVRFWREKCER